MNAPALRASVLVVLLVAGASAQTLTAEPAREPQPADPPIRLVAITPLGDDATAINAAGEATLTIGTQAWRFTPTHSNGVGGALSPLGTLGGTISIAAAINDAGVATGFSTLADGSYRAFLAGEGPMLSLGTLSGDFSSGTGLNAAGQVVGFAYGSDDNEHGFVWTPEAPGGTTGTMLELGTLGGVYSDALAVGPTGDVAGYAYTVAGAFHAFLWHAGHMTDLGTLGGSYSKAEAMDAAGDIVGQAYLPGNVKAHACLWKGGAPIDLGALNGEYSEALAIDPTGKYIVGQASVPGGPLLQYHAVLHVAGTLVDLNSLLPAHSGWLLQSAEGVNAAGQIVGQGVFAGKTRGFLLTPLL